MDKPQHFIEIACFDKHGALAAAQAGAHRLELCSNKSLGGISPDLNWVSEVIQETNIPIYLMVRPRGGDFFYSELEIKEMENYLIEAQNLAISGFVFGCLQKDFTLNLSHNQRLIDLANGKPCTLHKAFDETKFPLQTMEDAINIGFKNILTSGCAANALEGLPIISKLIVKACNRINIMPGGNIRSSNLAHIKNISGASWFHSAALIGQQNIPNADEIKALLNT